MEKKDKTILAIASGVFLMVLAFMLFVTFQSRDNLMNSAGRYNGGGIKLGDAVCTWRPSEQSPRVVESLGDCTATEPAPELNGTYCKLIETITGDQATGVCPEGVTTCYSVQNQTCYAPAATLTCPNVRVNETATCTLSGCTQTTCVITGGATPANPGIAQVASVTTDTVTVRGISSGSTTITAIVNGESISASITVEPVASNKITSISLSGCPSSIEIGAAPVTRTCTPVVSPTDHDDVIEWSSSNTAVATINATGETGRIYALQAGRTTITACSQADSSVCDSKEVTVTVNPNCAISAVNVSGFQHMSFSEIEEVRFDITGNGGLCGTQVDLQLNGFTANSGLETSAGVADPYHPSKKDCTNGTIKGCIKNDGTKCSETISITLMPDWTGPVTQPDVSEELHSRNKIAANQQGKDTAYENCVQNSDGLTYTCDRYTRGCGGSSGGGESTHCYIKRGNGTENEYCKGTASQCSGFTETINSTSCTEEDKCYLKSSDNTYVTGKYSGQEGYVEQEGECPTEEQACYKKANGDYEWTTSALAGQNAILIASAASPSACEPACYLDNGNSYDWGLHADDPNYTLVTGINSAAACKPETPDIPSTAANIATIMYIAVAAFTTIGAGFITYTSLKKNSI